MRPPVSPPRQSQSPNHKTSSPPPPKRPLSPNHENNNKPSSPVENGQDVKRRRLSTEQARGKRMFGALMGTLNSFQKQSTGRDSKLARQVEKRAEIDARIKERVAKEAEKIEAAKEKESRERREREEDMRLKLIAETVSPLRTLSGL
jgi:hypothetical protein